MKINQNNIEIPIANANNFGIIHPSKRITGIADMNTTTTLNTFQSQMDAITSKFGVDTCIAHADRVYSQDFRSEAVRICDHLNSLGLSMEQFYEEFNEISSELWGDIKSELYIKATGRAMPEIDCDEIDFDDEYYDSMMMSIGYAQQDWRAERDAWVESQGLISYEFINETTEIVFLCNYKGEGEGIAAFNSATAKLPIFKSKRESFMI